MTQPDFPFDSPETRCQKLASYFQARPNEWISALQLMSVGGVLAFRTRISNIRKPPYSMDIENRIERRGRAKHSFYRYVPAGEKTAAA